MTIELGQRVRDTVTGFEGIATAKVIYLNGCVQYCVKPKVAADGKMPVGEYIDEEQLVILEREAVSTGQEANGGPIPDVPSKTYNG